MCLFFWKTSALLLCIFEHLKSNYRWRVALCLKILFYYYCHLCSFEGFLWCLIEIIFVRSEFINLYSLWKIPFATGKHKIYPINCCRNRLFRYPLLLFASLCLYMLYSFQMNSWLWHLMPFVNACSSLESERGIL